MSFKYLEGRKISEIDLVLFQEKAKVIFSDSFKKFLLKYNNGRVEWNEYKVSENESGVLNSFVDLKDYIIKKKTLGIAGKSRYPIALSEGGNYVVYDFQTNEIYYWNHEMPYVEKKIAKNIDEFLLSIIPQKIEFDNKPVDPATVLDPEFYKMVLEQQEKEKNLYKE